MLAQEKKIRSVHKVQKKETVFSVADRYSLTIDQLIDANPLMRKPGYDWKKGVQVNIPYVEPEATTIEEIAKKNVEKRINVGVMLPLHNRDVEGQRMIEYYRGLLLAVDNMKQKGMNVSIRAWDLSQDTNVDNILADASISPLDVIIGPLYSKQVEKISNFCKKKDIKLIIPFSINSNAVDNNPNIFQVYQDNEQINKLAIKHFMEMNPAFHTIIIDCNDSTSKKVEFCDAFKAEVIKKQMKYYVTNLNSPAGSFVGCFRPAEHNVILLTSERSPELTAAIKKVNAVVEKNPGMKVTFLGYTDWFLYQKYNNNLANYCKYDTYIPTTYYYNSSSIKTNEVESKYRNTFNAELMNYIPRFALTGYDQGMFFLMGIYKYGKDFKGDKSQQLNDVIQNAYEFVKETEKSGYKNHFFQFVHYKPQGGIESIAY